MSGSRNVPFLSIPRLHVQVRINTYVIYIFCAPRYSMVTSSNYGHPYDLPQICPKPCMQHEGNDHGEAHRRDCEGEQAPGNGI